MGMIVCVCVCVCVWEGGCKGWVGGYDCVCVGGGVQRVGGWV